MKIAMDLLLLVDISSDLRSKMLRSETLVLLLECYVEGNQECSCLGIGKIIDPKGLNAA